MGLIVPCVMCSTLMTYGTLASTKPRSSSPSATRTAWCKTDLPRRQGHRTSHLAKHQGAHTSQAWSPTPHAVPHIAVITAVRMAAAPKYICSHVACRQSPKVSQPSQPTASPSTPATQCQDEDVPTHIHLPPPQAPTRSLWSLMK